MAQGTRRLYYAGASMSSPLRILAVDVGTGTQDILLFESGKTIENCFKMVMPSPTVIVADRIKRATERGQAILLTGVTMGGGPCHWAARDHALAGFAVAVTQEAGRTFDDDLEMVKQMGFEIIDEAEAEQRKENSGVVHIELQDFDARADLTRLRSISASAARYLEMSGSVPHSPLLLMDTGSAAVLGALEDPFVRGQHNSLLCNIGNFHTLAFHLVQGRIVGIFEHHTGEIDPPELEQMLVKLADGTLTNEEVFNTSGHGALILNDVDRGNGRELFPFLAVTGPRREMLRGSSLRPYEATPHGDMMLAGCFGLLRALADHEPAMAPLIEASLSR